MLSYFSDTKKTMATAILVLIPLLLSSQQCFGSPQAPFNWQPFEQALKKHVVDGEKQDIQANLVDYSALAQNTKFGAIGVALASYDPSQLTHKQKMAFYINAYNYYTLKLIIDHKPKKSIRELSSFIFPVWGKTAGKIHGEDVSLDGIEHKVLRKMGEPRIHFAIVCASLSCPNLRTEAYSAKKLEQQLEQQTRLFLKNTSKGVSLKNNALYISNIFEWFEGDFESQGGVLAFIKRYRPDTKKHKAFEVIPYNWNLNAQ